MIPPVRECSFANTHRLIPSRYSPEETVLGQLSDQEQEIQALIELDGATNARLLGEEGLLPDISVHELLYGVAYTEVVNAAFTHTIPSGSRFNSSRRVPGMPVSNGRHLLPKSLSIELSSLKRLTGSLRKYPPTAITSRTSVRIFTICGAIARGIRNTSKLARFQSAIATRNSWLRTCSC